MAVLGRIRKPPQTGFYAPTTPTTTPIMHWPLASCGGPSLRSPALRPPSSSGVALTSLQILSRQRPRPLVWVMAARLCAFPRLRATYVRLSFSSRGVSSAPGNPGMGRVPRLNVAAVYRRCTSRRQAAAPRTAMNISVNKRVLRMCVRENARKKMAVC